MNIVTIKFGQGTEAWRDIQEVATHTLFTRERVFR